MCKAVSWYYQFQVLYQVCNMTIRQTAWAQKKQEQLVMCLVTHCGTHAAARIAAEVFVHFSVWSTAALQQIPCSSCTWHDVEVQMTYCSVAVE